MSTYSKQIRILAVDDEPLILESYQNILAPEDEIETFDEFEDGEDDEDIIFEESTEDIVPPHFDLVTCSQGDEAVEQVKKSLEENNPFAVAFIDIRMPPGLDGISAAAQIRALDPYVHIVIVTAYSDIPPQKIADRIKSSAQLFYIQKPFHWHEIYHFAESLSENWQLMKNFAKVQSNLERQIAAKNDFVQNVNIKMNDALNDRVELEEQLQIKIKNIDEVNTALKILLEEREKDKVRIEENIFSNLKNNVFPYLESLKNSGLPERQNSLVDVVIASINGITSSFTRRLTTEFEDFTPMEIQVANLIKHGSSTKEIADLLNISPRTVESHRKNIRKKLGLTNKSMNLRIQLLKEN